MIIYGSFKETGFRLSFYVPFAFSYDFVNCYFNLLSIWSGIDYGDELDDKLDSFFGFFLSYSAYFFILSLYFLKSFNM